MGSDTFWFIDPGLLAEGKVYRACVSGDVVYLTDADNMTTINIYPKTWKIWVGKIKPLGTEAALMYSRNLLKRTKAKLYRELLLLAQDEWTDQEINIGYALSQDTDIQELLEEKM
jgi:hypothetical protein